MRVLATHLSADDFPAAVFAELYHQRWRIEEALDAAQTSQPFGTRLGPDSACVVGSKAAASKIPCETASKLGLQGVMAKLRWIGVSVGTDHDTSSFAVATIRRWWQSIGQVL